MKKRAETVAVPLYLPDELLYELRSIAIEDGVSMNMLIRTCLSEYAAWCKRKEKEVSNV